MLHEVSGIFDNQYRPRPPRPHDKVLAFGNQTLLMARSGDTVSLPSIEECPAGISEHNYLFSLDGQAFYLADEALAASSLKQASSQGIDAGQVDEAAPPESYSFEPLGMYRWIEPRETRLVVEVGSQLAAWYRDNRYCGRCGMRTEPDGTERMLRCPSCGNTVYPRINPGVIVGVMDGEDLLLTKYAGRGFTNWALVAGFTEIGESLEQTVAREVLEETGVHVKNIRYFGNQPWPRSSSLLVGFFAELDGSRQVKIDNQELACAEWVNWKDVPHEPDNYSLTRTMMCAFHERMRALHKA